MRFLVLLFLLIIISGCEKNPLWVGKKEHLTFNYNYQAEVIGPQISNLNIDKSPFVEYESIKAVDLGNGTVQIIVSGVRIQSSNNNFEIVKTEVYEKDDKKFKNQSEFGNVPTSEKNNIASVLVLDMSTSLSNANEVDNLKIYAKNFIDLVTGSTDSSIVSVVFFSGKENIYATQFYNAANSQILKDSIDAFVDYQPRTALFQATLTAISILDQLTFNGPKSIVVFTDGGDNDSDNPTTSKEAIADSDYYRIAIGLKGNDFDKEDLLAIATSKRDRIIAEKSSDLEGIFDKVARQVSSVYKIIYERSDQILDKKIEIKFEFEVEKLK